MKASKGTNDPITIFRYFSGIVALVFGLLFILSGQQSETNNYLARSYMHFALTYLFIFLYLAFPVIQDKLKKWYLPPVLVVASVVPIAIINIKYRGLLGIGAEVNTLEDSMTITFLLLFPLIITSWNYSFPIVFLYYVVLGLLEPLLIFLARDWGSGEAYTALTASLLRITALCATGYMITELREMQHRENKNLEETRKQLEEYTQHHERLAVSRERNRIARELHDTLAHTLSGLSIQLGAVETLIPPSDQQLKDMMGKAQSTVHEGLNETRRALKAMRASPLEEFGFSEAVSRLADNARVRDNLDIETEFPEPVPEWDPELEECLYRIIQEGLENTVRHARASKVKISLRVDDSKVTLHLSDDGLGLDPENQNKKGRFGLHGIRERAASIGGSLEILGSRGMGTAIEFQWENTA